MVCKLIEISLLYIILLFTMSLVKDYDQLVKLILIGSSGVGKSSLLIQFA